MRPYVREAQRHIRETFDLPLALMVFDTFAASAGLDDENSASQAQKALNVAATLSREAKALVVLIDHHGKVVETGIRGSSAKSAAADAILSVLCDRSPDGVISNRRMAVAKLRSGPMGRVVPFELRDYEATCTVEWRVTDEARPVTQPKAWPKSLAIFKRSLESALTDHGRKMRPFLDGPEVLAVDREMVRGEFMKAYPADNAKAKGEAFRRCEKEAVAMGFAGSRAAGPDFAQTVFWIVR